MWLWQIPMLILAFVGPLASIELSEPTGVQFDSVNFNNTLRWTQKGSQQTVYDVEYRIYGETKWKNKTECHHITAHYCDLTNEIVQDNNWYYARVMAISKNANSTWSLSERFCPLDKTIIGAPAVEYTAGNRSITVFMHLPQVPLRQGVQRSIKDIFATIEYEVQLKQSLTNKTVFNSLNESAYLKIESLEPNTKYCAKVQLRLIKELFSKKSQPAHFCIQTLQEKTLTIILLMAVVFFGAIITGIFCCMAYGYIKHRRTLPQSLNLDRIVLHERVLLEESSPTLQLVTSCKKDTFQFVQVIHMDNLDLLKYDSIEKEEIMKAKELTLTAELNSYAPQSHTRIQQAKLSGDTACEIQSNSSSKPTRSGRSSSYCPQATNSLSNNTYSNKNNSRALTQNYATIVHMTSQNSTKLNTDPRLSSAQKVPLNSLQTMSEDLLYNIEDLIFQNGLELEMQKLKLKEEKPMLLSPFLSLLDDKPQTYQSQWKENQPIETPLLVSLKDQKQINLPLFQHGQQIDSQSLLSLLKDEVDVSYLQSDRTDNQPIKVSLTGVLQTELKDGQLAKALLEDDTFTRLLHVTPEWEDGYKRQLLTSHSSTKQGQQTNASFLQTSQTNATMEGCKFLEDWEIQVHMDE
ncbi:interleukin-22 receptor subunit alpha-1-like isoform X2 [Carcharodon carcharias]|uniref:interleukin-22 receptor subunit alpha-1-like isoform X2 n=1 Tax=Carcharodon carcharias TaxID=13397 RepID=UPI001B7E82A4|nr:interleukin-22 receptor subunit alpha-1-like isoform X2 [Carcharodon carcharias]